MLLLSNLRLEVVGHDATKHLTTGYQLLGRGWEQCCISDTPKVIDLKRSARFVLSLGNVMEECARIYESRGGVQTGWEYTGWHIHKNLAGLLVFISQKLRKRIVSHAGLRLLPSEKDRAEGSCR
jgi:hypothetical protein